MIVNGVDIAVETLQAFADTAWDAANNDANSYRAQMRSYESQLVVLFASSGVLGSVSKNSVSQSYRGPGLGSYTVAQLQTAWRMLINLYDQQKKVTDTLWFFANNPPANPVPGWGCWYGITPAQFLAKYPTYNQDPDQAIYDFMLFRLEPVTEYQIDLTDLRFQPTLGALAPNTW